MTWKQLVERPQPYRGFLAYGAFGAWEIPTPPEDADDAQILDYASVVGYVVAVAPLRERLLGIAASVDQVVTAYLRTYYPLGTDGYFRPFTEGGQGQ